MTAYMWLYRVKCKCKTIFIMKEYLTLQLYLWLLQNIDTGDSSPWRKFTVSIFTFVFVKHPNNNSILQEGRSKNPWLALQNYSLLEIPACLSNCQLLNHMCWAGQTSSLSLATATCQKKVHSFWITAKS